ncbi:MAG: hypothetical protein GKR87_09225 [Kiritimatiellae bacterium]|nr:hypothetical protein [Kiritimatiellia bacterium]
MGFTSPIAFALDGFFIYGNQEPDGAFINTNVLDSFNGHKYSNSYHYHASTNYLYINGGIYLNPRLLQ